MLDAGEVEEKDAADLSEAVDECGVPVANDAAEVLDEDEEDASGEAEEAVGLFESIGFDVLNFGCLLGRYDGLLDWKKVN